jgi:hypothetical protein
MHRPEMMTTTIPRCQMWALIRLKTRTAWSCRQNHDQGQTARSESRVRHILILLSPLTIVRRAILFATADTERTAATTSCALSFLTG